MGALHQTSQALSNLATANLKQARLAVEGRRLLVSTGSLPERYNVPMRFIGAPQPYAVSLMACCQDNSEAAARATASSADIASLVGSSSRTLTACSALARDLPEARRSTGRAPD
jgi:hypothetical protein